MNNPNINMATLRVACSNCNLRELCLPLGLSLKDIEHLEELVSTRKRIKRGEALYRAGDKFDALYAIRLGFLKSAVMSSDGREQVTSFHMSGDIVGLDGLASMVYSSDLIALEDTEVCILPFDRLEELSQNMPAMSLHFQRMLSKEIVRQNGVMLLLGSMHAEERLAAFILNLSQRFEQRGYSRSEFVLRMTRAEIGSYLGLKLETVSRVLSRFSHDNLIVVNQKHVQIMDFEGLRNIVSGQVFVTNSPKNATVAIHKADAMAAPSIDSGIPGLR
ncbi:MAG: fumarate/nitrate reduction transcriptional regulator Fnr [Duodenibacillus sp.]|nr:fumarate/nitrate reduction transcriptional regulator Fnr [Duodenibacillus sp.]